MFVGAEDLTTDRHHAQIVSLVRRSDHYYDCWEHSDVGVWEKITEHYSDEFGGVPLAYAHQLEQDGLTHSLLTAEEPEDSPSTLVITGFYRFSPTIFNAYHLVQPSDRGEYGIREAIDLLIQSGRTIAAIGIDSWQIDIGYSENRNEAEERLHGELEA